MKKIKVKIRYLNVIYLKEERRIAREELSLEKSKKRTR